MFDNLCSVGDAEEMEKFKKENEIRQKAKSEIMNVLLNHNLTFHQCNAILQMCLTELDEKSQSLFFEK